MCSWVLCKFFLDYKEVAGYFFDDFFTRNLSYDQKEASLVSDGALAVQWSADRTLGSDSKSSEFESCNQFFFFHENLPFEFIWCRHKV